MKRNLIHITVFFTVFILAIPLHAQINEKIWFDGLSRSYFARDAINKSITDDTISALNTSNGYNLLDLNTHVNPIKNIEIFAQLRIRNSFGSFFGSGTGGRGEQHAQLHPAPDFSSPAPSPFSEAYLRAPLFVICGMVSKPRALSTILANVALVIKCSGGSLGAFQADNKAKPEACHQRFLSRPRIHL